MFDETGAPMLEISRVIAATTTVIAAILVAANGSPCVTIAGFSIFVVASVAWMLDGWLEGKASLLIQNAILPLVDIVGIWRWLPKAESS